MEKRVGKGNGGKGQRNEGDEERAGKEEGKGERRGEAER